MRRIVMVRIARSDFLRSAEQERVSRVNHQGLHRATTEEHSVRHRFSIGEGHLDRQALARDLENRFNHVAFFTVSSGIGDVAVIDDGRFADHHDIASTAQRMNAKPRERSPVFLENFQLEGVQGGRAGASVDFGFDDRQA